MKHEIEKSVGQRIKHAAPTMFSVGRSQRKHEARSKVLEKVKGYVKLPKVISPKEKKVSKERLNKAYEMRANKRYKAMSHKEREAEDRDFEETRRHPDKPHGYA